MVCLAETLQAEAEAQRQYDASRARVEAEDRRKLVAQVREEAKREFEEQAREAQRAAQVSGPRTEKGRPGATAMALSTHARALTAPTRLL